MANKKVKKVVGEIPAEVVVGKELVKFDENGEASVSEDIAGKLEQIPGYELEEVKKTPTPKNEEPPSEGNEDTEDGEPEKTPEEVPDEKPKAPKKPAPKKPAPKK